jgi:hypothetical protein
MLNLGHRTTIRMSAAAFTLKVDTCAPDYVRTTEVGLEPILDWNSHEDREEKQRRKDNLSRVAQVICGLHRIEEKNNVVAFPSKVAKKRKSRKAPAQVSSQPLHIEAM